MISVQLIRKFLKSAKLGNHVVPEYEKTCTAIVLNPPSIQLTYRNFKMSVTEKSITLYREERNGNLLAIKLVTFNRYISKSVLQSKFVTDLEYTIDVMYDALESLLTGGKA